MMTFSIDIDQTSADYNPGMPLILQNIWSVFDWNSVGPYARQSIKVAPAGRLPIVATLSINPNNVGLSQDTANCNTGLNFDWSGATGYCGKTKLEISIFAVYEIDSLNPLPEPIEANDEIFFYIQDGYTGFDGWDRSGLYTLPSSLYSQFMNK